MAKLVTYLGKESNKTSATVLEGHEPFEVGQPRLFDDAYATRFGFKSGDDFALFFTTIYNNGLKTPQFEMSDAPAAVKEEGPVAGQ